VEKQNKKFVPLVDTIEKQHKELIPGQQNLLFVEWKA